MSDRAKGSMNVVTIKDVAARAGVSPATASRVLSGHPATSPGSRERVEQAARELDFHPNAQARALRSTRSDTIGLLVSDVRNPFFADLAHTIEQELLACGYTTLLGNANEDPAQQDRYLDTLISRRADGVIVAPQGGGDPGAIQALLARGVPLVFVDRVLPGIPVPSVTTDPVPGIRQAAVHLRDRGHRRVGYIAGPQTASTGRDRLAAWADAAADAGLDADPALIHHGDFQAESGSAAVHRLFRLPDPPTALLAADSLMTVGALAMLQRLGHRIGEDVALIAFDDIEWFSLLNPPLSVIAHSVEEMGRHAVRLLREVIAGGAPDSILLSSELIVRASSSSPAPAPAAPARPSPPLSKEPS